MKKVVITDFIEVDDDLRPERSVLVKGDRFAVVRQRERVEDLLHGESIPRDLTG